MGIQELLYGVGTVLLLGALVYGVMRAGRKRQTTRREIEATRRNFDKA
ncbi:MAG TPA: hypothetical protein VNR39_01740 [Pseudolabrys sp.]|nr:hypothetical protein [Pseudolabrys sp.]